MIQHRKKLKIELSPRPRDFTVLSPGSNCGFSFNLTTKKKFVVELGVDDWSVINHQQFLTQIYFDIPAVTDYFVQLCRLIIIWSNLELLQQLQSVF
jgi:hypothetical protein